MRAWETRAWLLGAKLHHPLTERTDVYVRAALLRVEFDLDVRFGEPFGLDDPSDETGWAWGVGAEYEVMPRLSLGVAFNQYDVDLVEIDSYQLTLRVDLL